MAETPPVKNPAKTTRLIHVSMPAGVTLVAIVMYLQRQQGTIASQENPQLIGLVTAGVGLMSIAIALAMLRPRVAQRPSDQSPDDYWRGKNAAAALVVWAVIQGGALVSLVGYYLSGLWAPLAIIPIALVAFFLTRPSTFE
jgi:hypothetical protein